MDGIKAAFGGISTPVMDDGSSRQFHTVGVLRFEFRWPDGSLIHKGFARKCNKKCAKTAGKQRILTNIKKNEKAAKASAVAAFNVRCIMVRN